MDSVYAACTRVCRITRNGSLNRLTAMQSSNERTNCAVATFLGNSLCMCMWGSVTGLWASLSLQHKTRKH
jgi:hypothetical protein